MISLFWTDRRPPAFHVFSFDRATISSRKACDPAEGISARRSSPARLKPYHVETLKAIALLGGTKEYVNLSSGELGKLVGVSQQSASQRILELIRDGLVARDLATVGHVDCAVIMPIRTHHTDVLEVISKHYLRGSLGLKDGDIVELMVSL